ncbi:uncharacterized protein C8Q71DRAFT_862985 [Rhodofomes roseus]|uniref:Protein CPL1-like domain-containing protein n=1 Tax=Rhodofomes roseus TaxID=34475 RepID=A0ABQ8K100_9APHY|nr:uncharacterized protein C8Q71DRAFT_862985 [Rhodofomes roseus]KAH9829893.1 hypothetical protein C8Q71DRAFT_862985 [Rhodofomes roseus]
MRVLSALLLFLSMGITALARPRNSLHALTPPKPLPAARALKQHHVLRSSEDTCGHLTSSSLQLAAIDIDIDLTADILGIFLNIDICICISLLPLEVDVGLGLDALVPLLGLGDLNALLEAALNIGPVDDTHCTHCTYPPHAKAAPSCGDSISCGWNCEPPYVKEGDQCVCPAPWKECNGVCGSYPKGCGSSTPWKRDILANHARVSTGVVRTLADAQATCGRDETVCGVYGGSSRAYECLNVNTTLESCGGCTVPSPFLSISRSGSVSAPGVGLASASGVDCSSLPGVSRVSCVAGRCAVSSCSAGWVANTSGDGCVRASALAVQRKRADDALLDLVVDLTADIDIL